MSKQRPHPTGGLLGSQCRAWLVLFAVIIVYGCADSNTDAVPKHPSNTKATPPQEPATTINGHDSQLSSPPTAIDPLDEMISMMQPDGIPSIDNPLIRPLKEIDRGLHPRSPLLVVHIAGQARAYPIQVLMEHEIINDTLAEVPIAATWCPLCDSSIVFDRRVENNTLVFGVSGQIRNSNLVMFERKNGHYWQQANGKALNGPYKGTHLQVIPSRIMSTQAFREEFPKATVSLHPQRGVGSSHSQYPGNDGPDARPRMEFLPELPNIPIHPMARIIAVPDGNRWLAVADYPHGGVRRISGKQENMVLIQRPGAASAVDTVAIYRGRTLGDPVVFSDEFAGRSLNLQSSSTEDATAVLTDDDGNLYDIHGRCIAGPHQGRQLKQVAHRRYHAFAWYVFYPDTVWLDE